MISFLPPGASNRRIALVFLVGQLDRERTYSVYKMDYDVTAFDPIALDWLRPGMKLRTTIFLVKRVEDASVSGYDLYLLWDTDTRRFRPLPG
jgi:hypothetical protein